MASNRSTQRSETAQPANSPKDAFASLARAVARVEIAACSAAARSLADWAQATDRLAQTVGDELLRRVDGQSDSAELLAGVTRATSSHLQELSLLPRTATDHFDARLARVPINNRRPR